MPYLDIIEIEAGVERRSFVGKDGVVHWATCRDGECMLDEPVTEIEFDRQSEAAPQQEERT